MCFLRQTPTWVCGRQLSAAPTCVTRSRTTPSPACSPSTPSTSKYNPLESQRVLSVQVGYSLKFLKAEQKKRKPQLALNCPHSRSVNMDVLWAEIILKLSVLSVLIGRCTLCLLVTGDVGTSWLAVPALCSDSPLPTTVSASDTVSQLNKQNEMWAGANSHSKVVSQWLNATANVS